MQWGGVARRVTAVALWLALTACSGHESVMREARTAGGLATSVERVSEGVYDVFASYRRPSDTSAFAARVPESDRMMLQGLMQRAGQVAGENKARAFYAARPRSFRRSVERRYGYGGSSTPVASDYFARMRIILPGNDRRPEPGMILLDTAKAASFSFGSIQPEGATTR